MTPPPALPPKFLPGLHPLLTTKISTRTPLPASPLISTTPCSPPKSDSTPCLATPPPASPLPGLHSLPRHSTPTTRTPSRSKSLPGLHQNLHSLPHHQNLYQDSTKISTRTSPKSLPGLHPLPTRTPPPAHHQNLYQDSTPCLATPPPASPLISTTLSPLLTTKISTMTPPPASPLHPLPHHYQDSTPCLATPPPLPGLPRDQPGLHQISTPCLTIKISTRTSPKSLPVLCQDSTPCLATNQQRVQFCLVYSFHHTFNFLFQICRSEKDKLLIASKNCSTKKSPGKLLPMTSSTVTIFDLLHPFVGML